MLEEGMQGHRHPNPIQVFAFADAAIKKARQVV
jgi:hypothetical protein